MMKMLVWNDAKHAALLAGYPTWLVWRGTWRYQL